jgi:hypothetical protein
MWSRVSWLVLVLCSYAAAGTSIDQSLLLVQTPDGHGSGFLFGDARTVVTNRHVVEGMAVGDRVDLHPVVVEQSGWSDLGSPSEGRIRYIHPSLDLAVLEVSGVAPGNPMEVRASVSSKFLPRGEAVLAHGFPSLGSPMMSRGIICGHWRDPTSGARFYLTDAALAEGSSGGPVTDTAGRLVGIAVAVYDVPEEVGYEWGFVIPASVLSAVFPRGTGIGGLPKPLDVDALIRSFRDARVLSTRYDRGRDAIDRIGAESPTLETYFEALDRYVRGIERHMRIERPEDAGKLIEFNLHVASSAAARAITLIIRDDLPDGDVDRFTAMTEALDGVLVEATLREWTRIGHGDTDRVMTAMVSMMDVISTTADKAAREAKKACEILSGLGAAADPIELRSRSFVDFPDQLSTMIMGSVLIQRTRVALADLPSMADMQAELPSRHYNTLTRIVRTMEAAIARWEELDADCRMLCAIWTSEVDGGSPDEYRVWLRSVGLDVAGSDVFIMQPGETRTLGWDVNPGIGQLSVLATSDGADIDLVLRDPDGLEADRDEALDHWPVVSVERPRAGEWSIDLINATSGVVEVEMEIWE